MFAFTGWDMHSTQMVGKQAQCGEKQRILPHAMAKFCTGKI